MFEPIGRFFKSIGKVISGTYIFICNASWAVFLIWIILLGPAAFELENGRIEGFFDDKKKRHYNQQLTSSTEQHVE